MRLILVFVLLFFMSSCSNEFNSSKKNIDSLKNIESKGNNISVKIQNFHQKDIQNDSLLNILYLLNINLKSNLLNNFFNNSKKIDYSKASSYSLQFSYSDEHKYERENICFLNSLTKKNIICFSGFESSPKGFKNYFYFIQNIDGKWINISQFIIKKDVISLLENKFDTQIFYQKLNIGYSFVSAFTKFPFYFVFDNNSKILYYSDSTWKSLANLNFSEGKISISAKRSIIKKNLLSSEELDNCKVYDNIDKAIKDSNYVYILDLSANSLTKLSTKIASLKKLQMLVLNENDLSELPESFLKLKNLQILRINNNNLEKLPDGFDKLPVIEEISASYNNISELPVSLSKSKSLKILNLDNNHLSFLFDDCSELNNLNILNISNNNITNLPDNFGLIKNIISIDISNNPINTLPNSFFNLNNLIYLDISNTNIKDDEILKLMNTFPDLSIIMN